MKTNRKRSKKWRVNRVKAPLCCGTHMQRKKNEPGDDSPNAHPWSCSFWNFCRKRAQGAFMDSMA